MKTKLPHIGIFWVYKSTVLAKAMPLNSAEPIAFHSMTVTLAI